MQQAKVDIFVKQVMPTLEDDAFRSGVAAIMYRGIDGTPVKVTFTPRELGLEYDGQYLGSGGGGGELGAPA